MATFILNHKIDRKMAELDEQVRRAWELYSEGLRDLEGYEYDRAEEESWDLLQRRLRELDYQRAELSAVDSSI